VKPRCKLQSIPRQRFAHAEKLFHSLPAIFGNNVRILHQKLPFPVSFSGRSGNNKAKITEWSTKGLQVVKTGQVLLPNSEQSSSDGAIDPGVGSSEKATKQSAKGKPLRPEVAP
jgi:hypothetical protein